MEEVSTWGAASGFYPPNQESKLGTSSPTLGFKPPFRAPSLPCLPSICPLSLPITMLYPPSYTFRPPFLVTQ